MPYSAYRLLRIMSGFELPGPAWEGWSMHSGKLWTPEGFGFEPVDGAWWSLLVRQARAFRTLYEEKAGALRAGATEPSGRVPRREATGPDSSEAGRREAPPNLFIGHFGTQGGVDNFGGQRGRS